MKPQEDIGSLIKTKLQSAEKASNETTWERIQHSLEERKKKRRLAFYIKVGLAGLLLIISTFFMFNYMSTSPENIITSQEETPLKIDNQNSVTNKDKGVTEVALHTTTTSKNNDVKNVNADSNEEQEISKKEGVTSAPKDLDPRTKSEHTKAKTEAITVAVKNRENTSQIHVLKDASENSKNLDTIINRDDVLVTQTTQKIYYYYNSKSGQEMSSTDKRVIDSIVKSNEKKQDSLKTNN